MYYRALKYTNGGEEVTFRNFILLENAYNCLMPSPETQQQERWHIKMLPPVMHLFNNWMNNHGGQGTHWEVIGWNELDPETTIYIQTVQSWDSALPQF